MKVTEAAQNPSKVFEEVTRGNLTVRNASRKQYLKSARGHYVSAVAGQNPEKKEQTNFLASSVAEDHAFDQVAEAQEPAMLEQLKTLVEKDVEMQTPKGLFKGSKKQLQAVNLHLNKTLSKSITVQFEEVVNSRGVIQDEMGRMDAPISQAMMAVSLDSGNAKDCKESQPKGMLESSSLLKTVVSPKAEIENLKREHAELKDIDVGAESTNKNHQSNLFHCTPENEGCMAGKANCRPTYEVAQNKNETEYLKIKAKGHKRENEMLESYDKVVKRPRITHHINEDKDCGMRALDLSKSLPKRNYYTCVSTSESSARIIYNEDELESSSQQPVKSDNLEVGKLMVIEGRIEADKHDHASEFSIRDYVFSARNRDISTNWPFSQKHLQLCQKLGVTNVLPPFGPVYSLRDGTVKKCLAEKSVSTEESNLNGRPSVMKKHLLRGTMKDRRWNKEFVEGYKDLDTFSSEREKDLRFQTAAVICQSEVGSVSTSNLPLSEAISDEQEATASAAKKTKSSVSQTLDKKCRLALKLSVNSRRGVPEDITSACTIPSEAMTSKICPVCESFSSSSNTTLNAHIDQCLSSQSSPKWAKNSKLINPRIKPRKIRTMVDICATAPRCTLEDLDRRNGSSWATNLDIPSEDTGLRTEGSDHRECSIYTVTNRNDGSVYIDSNGRKIRILSKFNETAPSSSPKPREDPKVRKQSKKFKSCKFFSASRKRRLMKHLKYIRVTRQRKHYLSKACVTEDATCAGHKSHIGDQPPGSFSEGHKAQDLKNHKSSQTSTRCKSSKIIRSATKNDPEAITNICRYDLRPMKDLRVRSDHTATGRTLLKKYSHLPKKPLCSMRRSMRTSAFDSAGAGQMSQGSCGKTMGSSPPRSKIVGNKEAFLGDAEFDGKNTKECARKSLASVATPITSLETKIAIQPDARYYPAYPLEEMTSCNLETGMLLPNLSYNGECHSDCKLKGSAIDNICGGNVDEEIETWSTDTGEQSSAKQGYSQDGLKDTNRFSKRADGGQGKYDFVISAETRHGSKDFDDPVSSTRLAIGETDIRLNTCLDPTLQKVADVSVPLSKTMQGTDRFQSLLFRDESNAYFPQHGVRDEQLFYKDVSAAERSELKMGNADFYFGQGSSLLEIDPILIPGPPGCDLPSFSDMGSEDEDNVGNGDSSDSPLSAISTIINLDVTDEQVYRGWSGASSPMDTLTVFSQADAAKTEMVASVVNDLEEGPGRDQQCCCSRKEGIPWSAALKFQEPQLQGLLMTSLVTFPGEQCTDSTLTKWPYSLDDAISFSTYRRMETENLVNSVQTLDQYITSVNISAVEPHRPSDCDSASPTPVLRLMGKDLMVVNNEEDDPSLVQAAQNECVNRQVPPVTETSSKHDRIWEHPASQTPALVGPLPYEQDPYISSGQCSIVGISNMINSSRSSNYTSGNMYVDKHVHSGFSDLGAAPLQRRGQ